MYVITTECHISRADLVPEIADFAGDSSVYFEKPAPVLIVRGLDMLSGALPTISILMREIRIHSSSNGCQFLQ